MPVLIIEGAHDALIDPAGNDELLARARITGSTRVVAPSHEDVANGPRRRTEGPVTINRRRVLAGGLVAGVIISLSALAMVPIVGAQMDDALEARGVPPLGAGAMVFFVAQSFIFGVLLVWLYAAAQPRFPPGPRTAVLVAVLVWYVSHFSANVSNVMYGFMPVSLTIVGTIWALVELVVAGVAGAYLYRDGSPTESVRRAEGSDTSRS